MEEKYLTIIYNIYHFRYILSTGKLIQFPKLKKFNINRIN